MAKRGRRLLIPAVLVGAAIGTVAVFSLLLYFGYHEVGSSNFGVESYRGDKNGPLVWELTANRIQASFGTDWERLGFLGIGVISVAFMFYLRYLFPTFPINPIGFTVGASRIIREGFPSILIIWLTKSIIMKGGGLQAYKRASPLFLGMLMGYLVGIGLGVVVDVIWFDGDGHQLNNW